MPAANNAATKPAGEKIANPAANSDVRVSEGARALIGSWVNVADPESQTRFEPTRLIIRSSPSEVVIGRASYEPAAVTLHYMGQRVRFTFTIANDTLSLTPPDMPPGTPSLTFRRLATTPESLEIKALSFGTAEKLAPQRIEAIRAELAERSKRDQEARAGKDAAALAQQLDEATLKVDTENTAYLIGLVKEVGWIDADSFGPQAALNAFILVQHSPSLPLMLAALPKIESDVKAKHVDAQAFALLYDRTRVLVGERQRYGTQLCIDATGKTVLLLAEDPTNIDRRRAELGLAPLKEYLASFRAENGGKDPEFETE